MPVNSAEANFSLPEVASLTGSSLLTDVNDQLENRFHVDAAAANYESLNADNVDITDIPNIQHAWVQHGFIKPFRLLHQLSGSGFGTLMYVYKILLTLPVTSCSAERAMSRIRIIKNRLRSTMLDDWLSALLCLASERDILQQLSVEDIINKFAQCSESLRRQLVYS